MSPSYIPEDLKRKIREQARDRCGYCRSLQKYVLGALEIDHIVPKAKGGTDAEDNLWLACRLCNSYKGTQINGLDPETGRNVQLFNPRRQQWSRHFSWSKDGTRIIGKTSCGRATVVALQLNNLVAITVRQQWVIAGWHPPD